MNLGDIRYDRTHQCWVGVFRCWVGIVDGRWVILPCGHEQPMGCPTSQHESGKPGPDAGGG